MSLSDRSCPTPDKKAYDTRDAAIFFARTDGLRAYQCQCDRWHLSSQSRRGKRMGVSRKVA